MSSAAELLDFGFSKKVPIILQSEVAECGLACLAMILSFYGYKSSVANLRGCMSGGLQGCNLQQLMDAAEEKHLGSRALQCELQEIGQLQTPCVLHWDMNHFVVLESVSSSNSKVVIVDPAKGRLTMDLAQFSQHFTGIALELSPNEGFELKDIRNPLRLKQLWSGIQGLPSQLVLMLLLSVVLQLCALAMPYYMQIVMDEILLLADKSLMLVVFIGFCLITLFSTVASICRSFLLLRLSSLLSLFMGSNLFRHLSRLSMSFFEARHVGDVVSRFSSLGFIRERITQGVVETIIDGAMSVLVLALMFIYSPKLTFCVLAIALAYFLFRFVLYSRFKQANESLIECTAKEDSCFLETVRGMQAIRLFGAENKRLQNWQGRYADKINAEISIGYLNILYESFEKLLFGIGNLLVVYLGVMAVIGNTISIGVLISFIAYKRLLLERLMGLTEQIIQFRLLRLHLDRVSDIALEQQEAYREGHGVAKKVARDVPLLELRGLSFTYPGQYSATFSDVNLKIMPGDSLVITGPSGSGKTTLLKIMLGLLQPTEGAVLFQGVDIRELGLHQYRQQLAAVMQNDTLMAGTIADNVAFFDAQIDFEHLQSCCSMACIDEDIQSMVMGYNSLVGDMGSSLSGGQLQRVLLARALYRKPNILFLDEASSHLDINNEKRIYESLCASGQTVISVAHRSEAIASAKQVFRLDGGCNHHLLA